MQSSSDKISRARLQAAFAVRHNDHPMTRGLGHRCTAPCPLVDCNLYLPCDVVTQATMRLRVAVVDGEIRPSPGHHTTELHPTLSEFGN